MEAKEPNRKISDSELSGTEVNQTPSTQLIPAKSILPSSSSPLQKIAEVSTSPRPEVQKILSKNSNGTEILTSCPKNEAELQLYRVMQRASLLAYYDTLLEMGGDDVQQLCDAGEEEFLEIMALIGMASKPLHVRRLQKALQEWMTSPDLFKTPLPSTVSPSLNNITLSSGYGPSNTITNAAPSGVLNYTAPALTTSTSRDTPTIPMSPNQTQVATVETNNQKEITIVEQSTNSVIVNQGMGSPSQATPSLVESQISRLAEAAEILVKTLPQFQPKPHNTKKKICRNLENVMNMAEDDPRRMDEIRKYSAIYGRFDCKRNPQKPLTLHEVSVNEAAAQICRFAPALLTRRDDLFSLARQVVRDSGYQYTKGHSSFKTYNYQYSGKLSELNHHTKKPKVDSVTVLPSACDNGDVDKFKRQERLEQIAEELRILGEKTEELVQAAHQIRQTNDLSSAQSLQQEMEAVQSKQTQLLVEQSDLLKQPLPSRFYRRRILFNQVESSKHDTDDTDSQFSLSTASSPSQELGDSRDSLLRDGENSSNTNCAPSVKDPGKSSKQYVADILTEETIRYENRIKIKNLKILSRSDEIRVVSTRDSDIIAMANPELSMSCILLETKEQNGFRLSHNHDHVK